MANLILPEQETVSSVVPETVSPSAAQISLPSGPGGAESAWNFATVSALLLLVAVWAWKLYTTWEAWGNLTVDSGHEMYVPAMLAQGKVLYRDLWYPFGPASQYFTSYLFRVFGPRLNVLYWAGALSALGSAIFLYLTGMRLRLWVAGWAAGTVLLMEAFEPSVFCFPLPYSYAVVYGCFIGCVFLWLAVSGAYSRNRGWILAAGLAAAVALLLKPEFGVAAYCCMALWIGVRWLAQRSWRNLAKDSLATLPGILICGYVAWWMVSIAGAKFITQENIQSWPSSYFMKTFGKTWLAQTGFTVSRAAFLEAFHRAIPVAVVILALGVLLWWRGFDRRALLGKSLIVLGLGWYLVRKNFFVLSLKNSLTLLLSLVFFPRDVVLYIILAAVAAVVFLWRKPVTDRALAVALLLTFSGLLAFRVLMKTYSIGYAIYYNGPVVLSYLVLLSLAIPRTKRPRWFVFACEAALGLACLFPVYQHTRAMEAGGKDFVPLTTDRGTIRVTEHMAENYRAAIQFMKEKAALGQSVLSVPEDTSLYFFSGTVCPNRVYLFIPGAVAPGKMTEEAIREIEQKPVDYLLWSNRKFPEYGAAEFGKDFNREIGQYLESHYRPVGPLIPNHGDPKDWTAVVWERKLGQ
jgi:hypothetical protein